MLGYSAGAISKPAFHWVRNLLDPKAPAKEVAALDYQASSIFALAWNIGRHTLPRDVISDFDNFIEKLGIPRMEGSTGDMDHYFVDIERLPGEPGGERWDRHQFERGERAPPSGAMAHNYARSVKSSGCSNG